MKYTANLGQAALFSLVLTSLNLLFVQPAAATAQRVDNFVLLDHQGQAQELYYQSDASAVVLIVQSNECEAIDAKLAQYKALADDYAERGVQLWMINSTGDQGRDAIADEATRLGLDIPILHDSAQIIGRSLQLQQTAEVLVIDPASWQLIYRGPVDAGAREAIDGLVNGTPVAYREVAANGCLVSYPEAEEISYTETIAPILKENCVACHVDGGIAPWAMSEYRMVQGFAPMMREVIRTKRMPPWHADPEIGNWQHDAGMSDEETALLISWIEAGAPRGEGPDPLTRVEPVANEWPLGEPDLILEVPAYDVPATGTVDYQFPVIENPLDHDVWVVAATVIPGNTKVVHHVLMGSGDEAPEEGDRESVFQNYIMGYAPGNESAHMPEGTGVYVPVGGVYQLQLHYTPYGKAATDNTRVGLYFADADNPPANYLREQVVLNPMLSIPPNDGAFEVAAYFEFYHEAELHSLVPHSHYRGRSSSFELVYPDGETELILSVPNYDFNWQRTYSFVEPKTVPAGTRIVHRTVYDNSAKNPGNPDPSRTVPWGLQSEDEMLYGSVSYSWTEETSAQPIHSNQKADTAQWMGFMDANMDGKVSRDEMSERLRDSIGWKWYLLDRNFSGGLELGEMERLVESMNEG
jgi:hypothetical protein